MRRRDFVKALVSAGPAAAALGCRDSGPLPHDAGGRVLVLALDGLDPRIVKSMMHAGLLPNFSKLAQRGCFAKLATSTPPHTPVAFSSIITGADPGTHQIFDFIHRDPNPAATGLPMRPFFSTASTVEPGSAAAIPSGDWELPLAAGETELLRRGTPFWDHLVRAGVDTQIYYLPANYPPASPLGPGRFRLMSGMGTPDLLGGYGDFTLFSVDAPPGGRRVGGGRFLPLTVSGQRARGFLPGAENFLRKVGASQDAPAMKIAVEIVRDPSNLVAKIAISGNTVLLNQGEWSDWLPVRFDTGIPGATLLGAAGATTAVAGMVRLLLRRVQPNIELYVSPINIDPLMPATRISSPPELSRALAQQHGRFYTAGIPEDTKALSHGALSEDEFLAQSAIAMRERTAQYDDALEQFSHGCLVFYFGATDLVQHMFWRDRDPAHPGQRGGGQRYSHVVDDLYRGADELVGKALKALSPDDMLLVLSDHGFTSFRRGFNLNSWLAQQDYIRFMNPAVQGKRDMFFGVDWGRTSAYGLGLNALYLNLEGREKHGIVDRRRRRNLLRELGDRLVRVRDIDGGGIVDRIDLVEDLYPGADPRVAPDLIIGYADGYRASWSTVLGGMRRENVEDNLDRWSGDHSIAARLVPGMLLANRKLQAADPNITDIAPTILAAFGIAQPHAMSGRDLFA